MTQLVAYKAKDGTGVELTFETIVKHLVHGKPECVTKQEMVFFMGICKARGLNPFAKDCYLMKYSERDNAAIIISIDFFRARARAQTDCVGWTCGVIVEDSEGKIRYSAGLVKSNEEILGGWFKARPKGWDFDMEVEVNLSGYIKKTSQGDITKFWKPEKQATMITKVAESQGLRKVWPDEFAKLYVEEEIDRGEMVDAHFTTSDKKKAQPEGAQDVYKVKKAPVEEKTTEPEEKPEEKIDKETGEVLEFEHDDPEAVAAAAAALMDVTKDDEKISLYDMLKAMRPKTSPENLAKFRKTVEDFADEIRGWLDTPNQFEFYAYVLKKWNKTFGGSVPFPAAPPTPQEEVEEKKEANERPVADRKPDDQGKAGSELADNDAAAYDAKEPEPNGNSHEMLDRVSGEKKDRFISKMTDIANEICDTIESTEAFTEELKRRYHVAVFEKIKEEHWGDAIKHFGDWLQAKLDTE